MDRMPSYFMQINCSEFIYQSKQIKINPVGNTQMDFFEGFYSLAVFDDFKICSFSSFIIISNFCLASRSCLSSSWSSCLSASAWSSLCLSSASCDSEDGVSFSFSFSFSLLLTSWQRPTFKSLFAKMNYFMHIIISWISNTINLTLKWP